MTERERLAAGARLCEWLAEAYVGPTRIAPPPPGVAPTRRRRVEVHLVLWRHGLAAAFVLGRHIRDIVSSSTLPLPSQIWHRSGTSPSS